MILALAIFTLGAQLTSIGVGLAHAPHGWYIYLPMWAVMLMADEYSIALQRAGFRQRHARRILKLIVKTGRIAIKVRGGKGLARRWHQARLRSALRRLERIS